MEAQTICDNETFNNGVKRRKPGIIYLSIIPPNMNVTTLRAYFCKYGQIGRVYLQPQDIKKTKKSYSEGWIEYKSKRKAKYVQELLNNVAVGGKKSNPSHDFLWNIKYLPRFKWEHLNQRLEYERQIYKKRMGAEISQVNKEADAYSKAFLNRQNQNQKGISKQENEENFKKYFKQKLTEEEIQNRKKLTKKQKDEKFKKSIEKKKKKKQENKHDKNENDFFASSIFVGNDDDGE